MDLNRLFGMLARMVIRSATDAGIDAIATSDADFRRVESLHVYAPTDLVSPRQALA